MKIKTPKPWTIDFETRGIMPRPAYPPIPVGFSVLGPRDKKPKYYAWGHPTKNNCAYEQAHEVLRKIWYSGESMLFHNAKFDVDVAITHMGLAMPPEGIVHDTMYLLFLTDPHAATLSLKPSSERLLGMPPEEQDAVREWLMDNQPALREAGLLPADVELCNSKVSQYSPSGEPRNWGAWICLAPGDLVGTYAEGDVIRTRRLFDLLYPQVAEAGMVPAYERECRLMPIMLRNEQEGVRVNLKELRADAKIYSAAKEKVDAYIRERLGVPELNIDAKADLAAALDSSGVVTDWVMTPTGKKSTKKSNMTRDLFNDQNVAMALGYRNRLATCLGTFIQPWLRMAESSNGFIYTSWNQVKQTRADGGGKGTRTGRFSSTPNFQNIPKKLEDRDDGYDYEHPEFLDLPHLPLMRKYILPDDSKSVLLHRDYSQQELRVLGHFEDGELCARYNADPTLDVHNYVRDEIKALTGIEYSRKYVKETNFGIIYGMGYGALAEKIKDTVDTAKKLKKAQAKALPGMADLVKLINQIGSSGQCIVTWGGRQYFVEEPKNIKGRWVTFEYKLLNYLIQGSSADITKQALINYDKVKVHGRFLLSVHDEINISCPKEHVATEMAILREAMESIPLDVPLLSDGKSGKNWAALEKYKEAPWIRK